MTKGIDLTGQRFERLVVLGYSHFSASMGRMWKCECNCGNVTVVSGRNLRSGTSKSCGCYRKEVASKKASIHNMKGTRIYSIWQCMKRRCYDKNGDHFLYYGGRGITVCDEWVDNFVSFYEWAMSNGYNNLLTIDRKDVNGNYEPSNCRWVSQVVQQRNRTNNKMINYNGQTMCLAEWSEKTGLSSKTIQFRLSRGWPVERALAAI